MNSKKEGNVERDVPDRVEEFAAGDILALTPAALRIDSLKEMTPRLLHKIGKKNEFLVLDVFHTEENGQCVTLSPCCHEYVDRKTNKKRCTGHPGQYFEKVGHLNAKAGGKKSAHLLMPVIGEIFGFNYDETQQDAKFDGHVFGMRGSASGLPAKLMKTLLEEAKLL